MPANALIGAQQCQQSAWRQQKFGLDGLPKLFIADRECCIKQHVVLGNAAQCQRKQGAAQ